MAQPDKGGAAGKMKETNIKLFPVLDGLCGRTTPSTPASFRPDLWTLQAAVSEYEMEERTFYWLPRSGGRLGDGKHHTGEILYLERILQTDSDSHLRKKIDEQGTVIAGCFQHAMMFTG